MIDKFPMRGSCRAARFSTAAFASLVAAAVMLAATPLRAASYTWAVPWGDWSMASNWGGTLPASSDTAYVVNGGTVAITLPGEACGTLSLGGTAGSGTLQMTGGSLATAANQYMGNGGTGAFTQSGGTNTVSNNLYLAANAGDSGTYNLGGSGRVSASFEYVGSSGAGTFTQSGGTNSVSNYLYLGANAGSSGAYNLGGSGQVSAPYEYVGYSGTGAFTQSGGTNSSSNFYLGDSGGGSGTYGLSGSGRLSTSNEYVGFSGTGTFTQSGGSNSISSILYLGDNSGGSGAYGLSGSGRLSATYEYVGYSGSGTFTQSGGTNSAGSYLYLGVNAGGNGAYSLSGSGQLSAASEYVGYAAGATASFQQTGGTNTVSLLTIGSSGSYLLAGGALQVNGSLLNQGNFAGNSTPALLSAGGILDLTSGTWQNLGAVSLSMTANSLLIVPAGFSPSTGFANYSTLGLTHTLGTTLAVPAGQGFGGSGSIADPVNCQGTITAPSGGTINLSGGLTLSGTGTIGLGSGNLTTNDLASGISGGSLSVTNHYVGNGGTGTFTQSGGTNSISNNLYLGYNAGNAGTYSLSGSGQVSASNESVGYSGTGSFTQSGGGDNSSNLYLGNNAGSSGAYSLSGSGRLSASFEAVGYSGTGTFTQSGGTNGGSNNLSLGYNAGGSGTYNLSGSGQVSATNEYLGCFGAGTFTQSGGTQSVGTSLYLGFNTGGSGAYSLSGTGRVSAPSEYVGYSATGSFTQSGGTNNSGSSLYLGFNTGGNGAYNLSGSGQLSAGSEYVGLTSSATASFQQTGGTNTVSLLSIGSAGSYSLAGGALQVNGNLLNQGTFAGGSLPATLSANGILNLTGGTWQNLGNISLSMGGNSLLIVPAGFSPATGLASYSTLGLTHTAGSTLTVPAGQGFGGSGSIGDPVSCQGTITAASGGTLNLNAGLTLSGTGTVSLGNGSLTANDLISGISGGSLSVMNHYVGSGGTGTFTQSGGTNNIYNLYLGYGPSGNGTYNLNGTGVVVGQSTGAQYVGYSGAGSFIQSGGMNTLNVYSSPTGLYLGYNSGSSGAYSLSGTGQLQTLGSAYGAFQYVGYSGSGAFTQSGGTNTISDYNGGNFYVGYNAGSNGTYNLSGSGQLNTTGHVQGGTEYVGYSGTGTFLQSGGTNTVSTSFFVGLNSAASGTYNLSGNGLLSIGGTAYVGYSGSGTFTQSGGTNSAAQLNLGCNPGGFGAYGLSGSGLLSSGSEYVGQNSAATALFQQSGGNNVVANLHIGSGGRYQLSGGTLQINGVGLSNQGVFDGGGGAGLLSGANCVVDFSAGTLQNVGATAVSMGANSLFIVPAGFDTSKGFGAYVSLGITHTAGTTLTVPAGKQFSGSLSISDAVNCQGSIGAASLGSINLTNGLVLSGTGSVFLGSGNLTVNDTISGMSGASNLSISAGMYSGTQYVGYSGPGSFAQSGGTNTTNLYTSNIGLFLGYSIGSSGTYTLSGAGQLQTLGGGYGACQDVGYSGSGTFTQSGGTNTISDYNGGTLYLGYNAGSNGTYNLSGSGQLAVTSNGAECLGNSGTGTFTQSGGTNTLSGTLRLGSNAGSGGTYNLNGGKLAVSAIAAGSGIAAFNFSGGTLQTGSGFSTILPMTLGTSGGGATFDTAGYSATLSGSLSGPGSLAKVDSGTLTLAAINTYSGNTRVGGGTLALGNALALQNSTLDTSGSGAVSFGYLNSATLGGLTGPGKISLSNASSSSVALSVGNNNASATFSGALQGTGSLTKIGSGSLALSGSSTYAGPTTISQGELVVDGWLTSSAVSVNGGTLGGTGHLGSVTVNSGGQLAPGDPLGTLSVGGNLILSAGAVMDYELDTPTTSDMISCGSLTLNSQQFSDFNFTPSANFGRGSYPLIAFGSMSGSLGSNTSGTIDGLPATLAVQGNDLVVNVVPEPSTLALFAAGVLGLVGWAWRQRSR